MTKREFLNHIGQTMENPHLAYEITGTDCNGRRNPCRRGTLAYVQCWNYYRGSVWGIKADGGRALLYRIWN